MNILLRTQCFQLLKISKVSVRAFHKDFRLSAAQNFSNYESIKRDFKLEVPEYFNFAKDVLDHWAKMEKVGKRPSNPAFWWINDHGEEVKWNFQELGSLSKKFANILAEYCGLQRGDRIIVVLPAIPEWWLANVACLRTGTVLIPGTIQLTEKDILYRLQSSKAKCIITNDTLASTVDSIAPQCEALKYKLLVSEKPREGWGNLKEMINNITVMLIQMLFDVCQDEPSRTASTFCGDFYKTGDRGYMDEDGYFWFIARSDDVIISSGYRIGPFEVESALAEHPAVLESAVVSSPDPIRGEVVKAFVILKPDYKSCAQEKMKNELQEHVKRTTAPYKYPRKVEFVLELPKTISGKIKRNELRKKEWEKV
ncbi:acyl-coenzyme A synthetase ACSM3, mitochondrial-like [Gracilinanus agilis]|uniref:acyl-coenzyme A synthetase ACSM3, mitochondrial-like n=1 Tax=Gracilinanus agilis TaxID=191870 RepID=UPI001CFEF30B|nr:acyl-coenzyme A synthetase ACSM3, mitochondrial-like [Gracilinanus agilis]